MPSTASLIKSLKNDFPQFVFRKSSKFQWSHKDGTIEYDDNGTDIYLIFHEIAHGLLNHTDYSRDVELLSMECAAWEKAKQLASQYDLRIDDDFIQSNLDTYRDWLHKRSTCPKCSATGLQVKNDRYKCLACNHEWIVNEARTCAQRRYQIK